jgi:hypothetical protein
MLELATGKLYLPSSEHNQVILVEVETTVNLPKPSIY